MDRISGWLRQVPADDCPCGHSHRVTLPRWITGQGITAKFLDALCDFDTSHVWLLADPDTYAAAGQALEKMLGQQGKRVSHFVYQERHPEANAETVEAARLGVPADISLLLAVGSGTINDIAKVIAAEMKVPFIIYATAPSMDGYTSATSSLLIQGRKISLQTTAPDLVAADTDVLAAAPLEAIQSGVGDVIAKSVSLAEWEIASLITGEHFCPYIASLVKTALDLVIDESVRLRDRHHEAVLTLFDALLVSGLAMNLAGHSRPASGTEHYVSHLWDMRAASLGTTADTHGRQCGVAALLVMDLIERTLRIEPNAARAREHLLQFDLAGWHDELSVLLGPAADALIQAERDEQKYDPDRVRTRADRIIEQWPKITKILKNVLLRRDDAAYALNAVHAPVRVSDLRVSDPETVTVLLATKDIRDKYIITRLLFDIGETAVIYG